ncbi:hypothetical protein JOC76_005671 [Neobacillus cucumis]|nr:hypothetical protein [Neobacillus cucumis]
MSAADMGSLLGDKYVDNDRFLSSRLVCFYASFYCVFHPLFNLEIF